jgi:formylglycine-generating enzyme required for sulfatase activity
VTKKKYRLPTEAEFEHAAVAGAKAPWKMTEAEIDKVSWNYSNIEEMTSAVGKKAPNAFGLFDTLGNVGEWATDAKGQPVLCGPSFMQNPDEVSPSFKQRWQPSWQESDPQIPKSRWWLSDGPFCGFRLVCEG